MEALAGTSIRRDDGTAAMRLEIELVPKPLWGDSLFRLLTRGQWEKIRTVAVDRAAGRCEVCGALSARLIGHEQWTYDDEAGTRVLTGVKAVCGPCNSVTHFGRSRNLAALGQLDLQDVRDHFMRVNDIDWSSAESAIENAFALQRGRNKRNWTTDFGPYAAAIATRRAHFPEGRIPVRSRSDR